MQNNVDCVTQHPKSAIEAWQRVMLFSPSHQGQYLDDWKKENAFAGLMYGKRDSVTNRLPVHHNQPSSIRDRYSVSKLIEELKTPEEATRQACVAVYDRTRPPKEIDAANTKCERGKQCYTLGADGMLTNAQSEAQKRYQKENKGQVVNGYCLGRGTVTKANVGNRVAFSVPLQRAEDTIDQLQKEIDTKNNFQSDNCDQ